MIINTQTDLIENINHIPSPNADERPNGIDANLIVIHSISLPPGKYGNHWIEKLFTNQLPANEHPYFKEIEGMHVSSHILIQRDGTIIQFVPFDKRAWHAGESSYEGKPQCNDFSIGIELEGTDTDNFESAQYQQLSKIIQCLLQRYPTLSPERITAHSVISPGRKTDPGTGFSWEHLNKLLKDSE